MPQQTTKSLTIKRGDSGPAVTYLQRTLNQLSYNPGPVDGTFGYATETAVKNFQATHELRIDGIVGPKTWVALEMTGEKPTTALSWLGKYWYFPVLAVVLFALGRKY